MTQTFEELRIGGARIYRAPGRVNLIGEHTDYNDGFVMPAAIDLCTWVAIEPRDDRKLHIHSEDLSDSVVFDLDEPDPQARGHWSDYVRGVAVTLERVGYRLRGADLTIQSSVPIGAGLSSSAAIEVATGYAMLETAGQTVDSSLRISAWTPRAHGDSQRGIDRIGLAKLCQQAENEFVGMRCGIMDQFTSCCGQAGTALMLDCRSLEYRLLPLPEDVRLVICNTMVKHELGSSEYNTRRAECEAGVQHFAKLLPDIQALRDVTVNDLVRCGHDLNEVIYKRCRHVITENARVMEATVGLERGDLDAFGDLMAQSHRSLRDDYEVSCAELDTMVDLATRIEGVFGARMTGGGFGGCTINLVKADSVAEFKRTVARGYEQATGLAPEIFVCSTADGVS
jgi:galactokinase